MNKTKESQAPALPFVQVKKAEDREALLNEAAQQKLPVTFWTENKKLIIKNTQLNVSATFTSMSIRLPSTANMAAFSKYFSTAKKPSGFFNFGTPNCGVFLKAEFIQIEGFQIFFKAPDEFYKIQRRLGLRFPIPANFKLSAEITHPVTIQSMTCNVRDISLGGISVSVPKLAAIPFKKKLFLSKVSFILRNVKITCSGEVRHVRNPISKRDPDVRIGIQFINLNPTFTEILVKFMSEMAQKRFSKKITQK